MAEAPHIQILFVHLNNTIIIIKFKEKKVNDDMNEKQKP